VLRVLTLNIWNLDGDWRARREAIAAVLRKWDPDLVCLQEVVETDKGNQAEWLAAQLGGAYDVAFAAVKHHAGPARFGNAILSRWPIDESTTAELPHEPDDAEVQRVVAHARTNGVDVFSTHLAWQLHDADLRERQVQALVEFIEANAQPKATTGPIIAGDFNAEPDSTAIRYLTGLTSLAGKSTYFQDAWRLAGDGGPGLTWSRVNANAAKEHEPDRRIDYIFSGVHLDTGAGRPLECHVVADEPVDGVWPTDHFGVFAVLA
jgi:endonuclease/exonuclease/phosphatase family metal-dependent hydrolase